MSPQSPEQLTRNELDYQARTVTALQRSTQAREQAALAYLRAIKSQEQTIRDAFQAGVPTGLLTSLTGFVRSNLYRIRDDAQTTPADQSDPSTPPAETDVDPKALRAYAQRALRRMHPAGRAVEVNE